MVTQAQRSEVHDSTVPVPGSVFADKYQVEKLLGKGGLGVVFAATNLYTNRRVAIKLLNNELMSYAGATDRLLREAQITGSVKHPNIVDIYDVGISEGKVFLVMEYLQGQSLGAWMKSASRPVSELIRTLIEAMRGIVAAHAVGVVHRDLKPDNIFVCCDEKGKQVTTKVLDFGVSKFVYSAPDIKEANITQAGLMVGTPNYMPPEQIRDPRYVDQRADIYALGIILYEILAGQIPFSSLTFGDLLIEIVHEGAPSLAKYRPTLPEGVIAVVDKAVARDRDKRYANIKDFISALEPYVHIFEDDVSRVRVVTDPQNSEIVPSSTGDSGAAKKTAGDSLISGIKRRIPVRPMVLVTGAIAVAVVAHFGFSGTSSSTVSKHDSTARSPAGDVKKASPETQSVEGVSAAPSLPVAASFETKASSAKQPVPQGDPSGVAMSTDAVSGIPGLQEASLNRSDKERIAANDSVSATQLAKDREKRLKDKGERAETVSKAKAHEKRVLAKAALAAKRMEVTAGNGSKQESESEEARTPVRPKIRVTSEDF